MIDATSASLVLAGTGIKYLSHLTVETSTYIKQSDKVLYLVNEPAIKEWIKRNSKASESLEPLYYKHSLRKDCYQAITNHILNEVKKSQHVCVILYGHPSVYAQPGINAIKEAREEGYYAKILPGISAEDCLFADLAIDPGSSGCHSFEATDFLLYKRKFDPRGHLILWQVDIIGVLTNPDSPHNNLKGATFLTKYLCNFYEPSHEAILYEASQYPGMEPRIQPIKISDLPGACISRISTLYIPPIKDKWYDTGFIDELNINITELYND